MRLSVPSSTANEPMDIATWHRATYVFRQRPDDRRPDHRRLFALRKWHHASEFIPCVVIFFRETRTGVQRPRLVIRNTMRITIGLAHGICNTTTIKRNSCVSKLKVVLISVHFSEAARPRLGVSKSCPGVARLSASTPISAQCKFVCPLKRTSSGSARSLRGSCRLIQQSR